MPISLRRLNTVMRIGVVDDDDADDGQHRDDRIAGVVDGALQRDEDLDHIGRDADVVDALDLAQLAGRRLDVIGAVHHDAVVGVKRDVVGKRGREVDVLHLGVIILQHFLRREVGDADDVLGTADGRVGGGDLFLAGVGAHVDDGQVLVAHVLDHGADVDAQQVGRADQQHADRQHAHGGERHQPVGAQVVQALPDQVGKAGKKRMVSPSLQWRYSSSYSSYSCARAAILAA